MANIPTIPGSARVADQSIGTKINPATRIGPAGALRQTAQRANAGVQEALGGIQEYEEKKRKAEEAYVFNSSSLSFQKLHSQFLSNAKKLPDEQIVPQWTQTTQAWKQSQLDQYGSKLSNRAKQMFMMQTDNAIGGTTAKFQVMADKLGTQRRESTAVANWDEFLKSGDPAMASKATSALSIAVKAGDMTQDKMDFYTSQIPQVLQRHQIINGMSSNPWATLEDIKKGKYPAVPDQQIKTLRRDTEVELANQQGLARDKFIERLDGKDIVGENEISEAEKAHTLSAAGAKAIRSRISQDAYKDADNTQRLLLLDSSNHDWEGDQTPKKTLEDFKTQAASLPPALRKSAVDSFQRDYNKAQKSTAKTIHDRQDDLMRQSYEESTGRILISPQKEGEPARRAESLDSIRDMSDDQFEATYGKDANRSEILKTANNYLRSEKMRYATAHQAYSEWSRTKKGQEATPEQADAERERLGFGRYSTPADVVAAAQAGKMDRGTAKGILLRQFGIP